MRVKRDQGNGNDGQRVDSGNTVDHGPAENQPQHAERDTEKDQNSGNEEGLCQPNVFPKCSSNAPAIARVASSVSVVFTSSQ